MKSPPPDLHPRPAFRVPGNLTYPLVADLFILHALESPAWTKGRRKPESRPDARQITEKLKRGSVQIRYQEWCTRLLAIYPRCSPQLPDYPDARASAG